MALEDNDVDVDSNVVAVEFRVSNVYGRRGTVGYVPEGLVDAWVARGIAVRVGKPKKSRKKKEAVEEVVVSDGRIQGNSEVGEQGLPVTEGDTSGVHSEDGSSSS